jgi:hypothetical protein
MRSVEIRYYVIAIISEIQGSHDGNYKDYYAVRHDASSVLKREAAHSSETSVKY